MAFTALIRRITDQKSSSKIDRQSMVNYLEPKNPSNSRRNTLNLEPYVAAALVFEAEIECLELLVNNKGKKVTPDIDLSKKYYFDKIDFNNKGYLSASDLVDFLNGHHDTELILSDVQAVYPRLCVSNGSHLVFADWKELCSKVGVFIDGKESKSRKLVYHE